MPPPPSNNVHDDQLAAMAKAMASDSESDDDFESSSDNGDDEEAEGMSTPDEQSSEESLMEVNTDMEEDIMEQISEWQKDIWHQKYLPYYDQMEPEADEQLKVIKAGLAHSIILRDVRPALLHWICELDKYINLYSRRFSKTDHVALVNLIYECMIMKGLEYRMVKVCSHSLSTLLGKKELLSREDLTLQWRPLYDIYVDVTCKNLEEDGMMLLPDGLKTSLETVIGHARTYFPLQATREILDEVRPYMCPWDESMMRAMNMLHLFLPTCLSHDQHNKYGAKLWFEEMWHWFNAVENSAPWETKVGLILARLTRESPGYIDWSDKYDVICTRLLRAFDLDIGQDQIPVGSGAGVFSLDAAAAWFCYMLGGPDDGIQGHITRLFRSLESYFHPSNYGHHTANLLTFVLKLVQSVCTRLNRERHRKPNSHPLVPPSMRLTNRQVDLFVESVLPSTLLTVFSKYKQEFAPGIVRFLGLLAPRLVVPAVLDTVYPALETLTEPHRLLQSMNCLVAVCVSLVRDGDNDSSHKRRPLVFADDQSGRPCRSHVISLLNAVLPGLDANDIGKSMVTFQTIGLFCALVPIVDCSEAVHVRDDLTEEERELCSATANFEGIVELLMTRMFALIETCAHGQSMTTVQSSLTAKAQAKFSFEENLMKNGIFSVFRTLVGNCSTPIYKVAVDRLYEFVNENMFDSRIAADTLAEMIFCAVRTNPAESLPRFLNLILKRLRAAVTEDTHIEEEVDSSVMWYVVLASQLVRVSGTQIVRFKAEILELLSLVMPIKCRQAHDIACTLLENVLTVLTTHYVDMHEFNRRKLDQPFEKFLPIRHWARTVDRKSWELKWHVPSEEELSLVDEIFRLFLTPELDRLSRPNDMTKEEVLKSLLTIKAAIAGSSALLPIFETDPVVLTDSAVDMHPFNYTIAAASVRNLTLGKGEHARQKILNTMHGLIDFSLKNREDDTKSLAAICKIYQLILFHRGLDKAKYDKQLQGFNMSKRIVGDAVRGNRANIEAITQEFVVLQHHKRLLTRSGYYFTQSHLDIMRDMVRVGTSMYSVVRVEAQKTLDACVQSFPYSYKHILDDVLLLLKEDSTISHEQFKGALYILLNGKKLCICVRQTWETLLKVWPAVVTAQHSEKPSVIALLELAQNTVVDNLESFQIRFKFSDSCVQMAKKLWSLPPGHHPLKWPVPAAKEEQHAIERETKRSDDNEKLYYALIDKLVTLSNDASLHWRHADMAQSLLSLLIRRDMDYPDEAVRLYVRLLVHDSIKTRRMASALIGAWLKMSKPKAVKVPFSPPVKLPNRTVGANWPIEHGFLADNQFLLYEQATLPKNAEEWDRMVFVDKTHWGFYTWPKELLIYAPTSSQKTANRKQTELTPVELFIVEQFNDIEFVDKLVGFMALEEKQGEDLFNAMSFGLFYGLFRNLNDLLVPVFRRLLEKLVKSEKEGEQRLAAEIVAGLVHGGRLWSYDKLTSLWAWLNPLLTNALENVTTDTAKNWGTGMATIVGSRDPRRIHWLLDVLFCLCEKPSESSFHSTTRFFLLQGALNQCEWRVTELWHRLADLCRPILVQPYQNLRDRLGSCLATVVWFDINGIRVDESAISPRLRPPSLNGIIEEMANPSGKMKVLWTEVVTVQEDDNNKMQVDGVNDKQPAGDATNGPHDKERKEALLALKTLLCYLNTHWVHGLVSLPDSIIRLLPLLAHFENETSDDELKRDAHWQLRRSMSHALVVDSNADKILTVCHEIIESSRWWKAKVSALKYIQVAVFSNLFTFLRPDRIAQVRRLIFATIADKRLEVREAAAESLSGFIHCAYFDVNADMTKEFCSWALSKEAARRHAGVLALAAIVQAFPYTVPDSLPYVLMKLCLHASDKQPMQGTVKKALSEFKRTHQDCWHEHKERFSDDQLAVLTDLLVSPNYYV